MRRLKLVFKATRKRKRFGSRGLHLKDGNTAEVSKGLADHLLKYFAENFFILEDLGDREAALDEVIEIFNAPSESLKVQGLYVTKDGKLEIEYEI